MKTWKILLAVSLLGTGLAALISACGNNKSVVSPMANPVPSFTFTATPCNWPSQTCTPTLTWTPCFTGTPTYTPTATGYSLSGTITYSPGGVSAAHPIGMIAVNTSGILGTASVASNGSAYSIPGIAGPTTCILGYWYNNVGDGVSQVGAHVGDYAGLYGGTSCYLATGSPIIVNGNVTQNVTFSNSTQLFGVGGTATYSGNKGTVDPCHLMMVEIFPDSSYNPVSILGLALVQTNGARYDAIPLYNNLSDLCASKQVYLQAFYMAPGTAASVTIQAGDPYLQMGPISTGTVANTNLTLTDSAVK